jgi:glycosyltransferase involved in cell wall biosynthesis
MSPKAKLQISSAEFKKNIISCVVPVYNEESLIAEFIKALEQCLCALGHPFEIIIVDDGSEDQTEAILKALKQHHAFHYLRFSRNFGKERALSAGLNFAKGDAVILLDADFQHPLSLIPQLNHG